VIFIIFLTDFCLALAIILHSNAAEFPVPLAYFFGVCHVA